MYVDSSNYVTLKNLMQFAFTSVFDEVKTYEK